MERPDDINQVTGRDNSTLPAEPYRGIKPFRYADRNIFAAREWEKDQLINLVSLYRGSLVFGESGIGKSSLINAGLVPELMEHNFQTEIIRISPNRNGTFIIYRIAESDRKENFLPSLFDSMKTSSSEIIVSFDDFKKTIFSQRYKPDVITSNDEAAEEEPIPVLIFDQFEELITMFEEAGSKTLAETEVPQENRRAFQAELIEFFKQSYYDKKLRIKFLFVFREDYLAKFSKLLRAIPDLRDHSLRIKAISKEDLYGIIECPFAKKESAGLYKNPFNEEQATRLTSLLTEYFGENNAVLTDIQIVCQYLYETEPEKRNEVLTQAEPVRKMINSFYRQQLDRLPANDKRLAIDILSLLVLNESTRNIYHTEAVIDDLKSQYDPALIRSVLNKLDNETRLVRSEARSGGIYYEINSESIIPYINSLKNERKIEKQLDEEKRQNELLTERINKEVDDKTAAIKSRERFKWLFAGVLGIFLLVAVLVAVRQFRMRVHDSGLLNLNAAKSVDNPTLGYIIARQAYDDNKSSVELQEYVQAHDNKHPNIVSMLNYGDEIKAAFFEADSNIRVISKNSIEVFSRQGDLLKEQLLDDIVYVDQLSGFLFNKKAASNNEIPDTIQLVSARGQIISSVPVMSPFLFKISPDGTAFVINNTIYNAEQSRPTGKILFPVQTATKNAEKTMPDIAAVLFTNDSKNEIVSFANGNIYLFDQQGRSVGPGLQANEDFSADQLALTADSKYVFAQGGRTVKYFELETLMPAAKKQASSGNTIKINQLGNEEENTTKIKIEKIVLAPHAEKLISIEGGSKASIRDFSGKEIGVLLGHRESIDGASYSHDGKYIVTWSSAGRIFLWKDAPAKELYNRELAVFSPFDYRVAGLESHYDIKKFYKDTSNTRQLFEATLKYSASLPGTNEYPDDEDYTKTLENSVLEVRGLYRELLTPRHIKKLGPLSLKLLYNKYADFLKNRKSLLKNDSLVTETEQERKEIYWRNKSLLTDTLDIKKALLLADLNINQARKYENSLDSNDHKKAIEYLKSGIGLLQAFQIKYQGNQDLASLLDHFQSEMLWHRLLLKDYRDAIQMAEDLSKKSPVINIFIESSRALAYLLSRDFVKARSIYQQFKNAKLGYTNPKTILWYDLATIDSQKLIPKTDTVLVKEVEAIRKLLHNP